MLKELNRWSLLSSQRNYWLMLHKKSIRGGIRINLNLLDAQQQLHTARRDLAEARYNYLLAYLRLQLASGTLVLDDLRNIAGYFIINHH